MASFFSKLLSAFGAGDTGSTSPQAATPQGDPHPHGDCLIYPAPIKEGGQYRLAGRIEKQIDGETLVHEFVRADLFSGRDEAVEFALRKARLIIDQSEPPLFTRKEP